MPFSGHAIITRTGAQDSWAAVHLRGQQGDAAPAGVAQRQRDRPPFPPS